MNVAFGMKAHSGWAALVTVGELDDDFVVVDRRRIELAEDRWARQPYHAAAAKPAEARDVVERGVEAAHRLAARELRAVVERERARGNAVTAGAVLVGAPMPDWTTEEIVAVHFRKHKAEGVLFRDALARGTEACGVRLVTLPEKQLASVAQSALGMPVGRLAKTLATLGRSVGPPWGKDQKDAALAGLVALQRGLTRGSDPAPAAGGSGPARGDPRRRG